MIKKRVSICGVKRTIEIPNGYSRVYKGQIKKGDRWWWKDGLFGGIITVESLSHVEDGWECIFRKDKPIQKKVKFPLATKTTFEFDPTKKVTINFPNGFKVKKVSPNVFNIVPKN
jgi:hypothetical protein